MTTPKEPKQTKAEIAADNYINGNFSLVWQYVGKSALKLLKVHAAIGAQGSNLQKQFIYSARNHFDV